MTLDVRAGPWSFALPDDWRDASGDPAVPYFERADETWGCYVKVVRFAASDAPPDLAALAERVQKFHEASLAAAPDTAWAVQARAATASDETGESILDYLDAQRQYRIVSVVQVAPPLGLHLTLHHYLCESYEDSRAYSTGILASVAHTGGTDADVADEP